MKKPKSISKKFVFLGVILGLFIMIKLFSNLDSKPTTQNFGITYSPSYAKYLGLDWQKSYLDILSELNIKVIRIPTYWDSLEPQQDQFDFSQTDFMVNEASKKDIKILLVVGYKQPRWPECHAPQWAKSLSLEERQHRNLNQIEKVIQRYKDDKNIFAYQVENEPLFEFGYNCDPPDLEYLKKEVALVKSLDPDHPIIITDSGEWSMWRDSMKLSDILGISLYRLTYNDRFGYTKYPFPASFYSLKSKIIRNLFAPNNQKTYLVELQTEPWPKDPLDKTPIEEQTKIFTLNDLKTHTKMGQDTNFEQVYFWGVEWWYYMKLHNHPEYWDYIQSVLNTN